MTPFSEKGQGSSEVVFLKAIEEEFPMSSGTLRRASRFMFIADGFIAFRVKLLFTSRTIIFI